MRLQIVSLVRDAKFCVLVNIYTWQRLQAIVFEPGSKVYFSEGLVRNPVRLLSGSFHVVVVLDRWMLHAELN